MSSHQILSGSKELRQVPDTSEGGESPTCCGLENRYKESRSAQSNDVFGPDFESKMDPYFTSSFREHKWGRYSRWDKDHAKSALATTRPIK